MKPRSGERADEAEGDDWLPPEEAGRRRDDALRRALSMPPHGKRQPKPSPHRVEKDTDRAKKRV
jgi:hypothetical protein